MRAPSSTIWTHGARSGSQPSPGEAVAYGKCTRLAPAICSTTGNDVAAGVPAGEKGKPDEPNACTVPPGPKGPTARTRTDAGPSVRTVRTLATVSVTTATCGWHPRPRIRAG